MEQFVFMYPIPENFEPELSIGSKLFKSELNIEKGFKGIYRTVLNECIDKRYRQNGFQINWAIFNHHDISDMIKRCEKDRILEVGIGFNTPATEINGKYQYPNEDYILDKLAESGEINSLRVAGFHAFDCVEKLAKRAYERGINSLVDEDLTEFLTHRMIMPGFKVDKYPTFNPFLLDINVKDRFFNARKKKPWFWQDYTQIK